MISIEDIEKKENELIEFKKKHEKELEDIKWQYIEEKYNLQKGCICRIKGNYAVLDRVESVSEDVAFLYLKKNK